MRIYATAQQIGTRTNQCDATAVRTINGVRAYVLLDGIGSDEDVREWTRTAAVRLALAAARRGDAGSALRAEYGRYAAEPRRQDEYLARYQPGAAAIVAVATPGRPLSIAWCGDARAYILPAVGLRLRCVTRDHNLRRVYPPADWHDGGNRNVITSYLGDSWDDDRARARYNHPTIETATWPAEDVRLVLASDGAYEPHEDAGSMTPESLMGDPPEVARRLVRTAVALSLRATAGEQEQHADNATVMVADIRP